MFSLTTLTLLEDVRAMKIKNGQLTKTQIFLTNGHRTPLNNWCTLGHTLFTKHIGAQPETCALRTCCDGSGDIIIFEVERCIMGNIS